MMLPARIAPAEGVELLGIKINGYGPNDSDILFREFVADRLIFSTSIDRHIDVSFSLLRVDPLARLVAIFWQEERGGLSLPVQPDCKQVVSAIRKASEKRQCEGGV